MPLGEASWFALPVDFGRDPRMSRLRRELKNPCADAYLARVWAWAKLYLPPSGDLVGIDPRDLEAAAGWNGKSGRLVAALKAAGYVQNDCLAGWYDLNGWLTIRAEKDRDRKREERANAKQPKGKR